MKYRIQKTKIQLVGFATLSFFFFGALFYLLFKFLPFELTFYKHYSVTNHFLNIIHAFFLLLCTGLILSKKIKETTWEKLLAITQGYLLLDTALTFYLLKIASQNAKNQIILILIHHIALLMLSCYSAFRPFLKRGLRSEITIPFLATGLVIMTVAPHYEETLFFYILIAIIVLLYFIFRICNFTYLLLQSTMFFYKQQKNNFNALQAMHIFWAFLLFLTITAINYYWFGKMISSIYRILMK